MKFRLTRLGDPATACAAMLLAALVLLPGRAEAAISSCSLSSRGVAFSPYDSQTQAAVDGAGTITVTCTGTGSSNWLGLSLTGGNAGTCSGRRMRSGSNNLYYQIYRDAARSSAFCSGEKALTFNFNFSTGSTQTQDFTMYGRVLGGQNPVYGLYSDMLNITLTEGGEDGDNVYASSTASITGSVSPICTVASDTLGFGTYSHPAASLSAATVTVNCSNGASYQVGLGGGSNQSGSVRRMAGPGGALLSYELYSDSARTAAWGDGGALGARVSGTGTGTPQSLTVYGRIPAGQPVAAGSYADSVLVTVEY